MQATPQNNRNVGESFERLAQEFLSKKGYRSLEANFRTRRGEIDLISIQDRTLVFVEVRSRQDPGAIWLTESISRAKQNRIRGAARVYLSCRASELRAAKISGCRFDVLLFYQGKWEHLEDAF